MKLLPPFSKFAKKSFILISITILVVTGLLIVKPVLTALKDWRADNLLAEAEEYVDDSNWEEASRAAKASFQNSPSLPALRILQNALLNLRDPQALQIAVAVFNHPESQAADKALTLSLLLDRGDILNTKRMVEEIEEETRENPQIHRELVRLALMEKQFDKAIKMVDESPQSGDPELDLLLAREFFQSGQLEARGATSERLLRVLKSENKNAALNAMRFLATLPSNWINREVAQSALEKFSPEEDLTVADKLRLDFLRIGVSDNKSEDIEDLVQENIAHYWDPEQSDSFEPLISWLFRLGRWADVVALTEADELGDNITLQIFQQRLQALEATGDLSQIVLELEKPPVVLPDVMRLASLATIENKRGETPKAIQLWSRAFEAAAQNRQQNYYRFLANAAKNSDDTERTMRALALALEHPQQASLSPKEQGEVFSWLVKNNKTKRLLRISYRLLQTQPNNPLLINNYLYLKSLLEEVNPEDEATMKNLVAKYPKTAPFHSSLALILFKLGKTEEALASLKTLDNPAAELDNSGRALYAALLKKTGNQQDAEKISESIELAELLPIEKQLLQNLSARTEEEQKGAL